MTNIRYFRRNAYLYPTERICYEKTSISGHRLIVCICITVRSTAGVCLYPLFVRRGTFAEYCHEYSARQKGKYVVSTWDGINKFDGYDFKTYKAKFDNRINLTNNRVDYMYEDRYGFLWLLTYDNQAWRFNPRTEVFEHVPAMKEEGSRFVVTSIKVLPCGSVWLLSEEEGAIRLKTDPESFHLSPEMYSADNGLVPGRTRI